MKKTRRFVDSKEN